MTALPGSPGWTRFLAVAAGKADAPAIVEAAGGTTDFAALAGCAAAQALHGPVASVAPGARVLLWSRNTAAMAASVLAVWARGAVPVLLPAQTPPRHVAHAASVTAAALVLAEPSATEAARGATQRPVATLEMPPPASVPQDGRPAEASHDAEPASILFTSGSTGPPKGVVQSHATLAQGCAAVARALGLGAEERILCGVPWGFDYGWGQLLSTFFLGAAQVIPGSQDPLAVTEAITCARPSVLAAVPSLLAALLQGVSGIERADLASLRLVTNTGSRIPPALFEATRRRFGHAAISLNYGMTETYRTASLDPALARSHPDSVGRAIPGVGIAVVDEAGRPVAPGQVGEVVHRGAGVFLGYWGDPEATARVRRPDPLWRHGGVAAPPAVFTGDLGAVGPDGLLRLAGRRDRQIKSMGVRVSPEEVEDILLASGLVREAAVLARPDDVIGDLVVAVIVPDRPGEDMLPALKRLAREEMSPFMQPRAWHLLDGPLPRTPSGKVDYPALRARFGSATIPGGGA